MSPIEAIKTLDPYAIHIGDQNVGYLSEIHVTRIGDQNAGSLREIPGAKEAIKMMDPYGYFM